MGRLKTAKELAAKKIRDGLVGCSYEWLRSEMVFGNGCLPTGDEGWGIHYDYREHPDYGTVVIYGDYNEVNGDSNVYFAVTTELDKRISSKEDYDAVMLVHLS